MQLNLQKHQQFVFNMKYNKTICLVNSEFMNGVSC